LRTSGDSGDGDIIAFSGVLVLAAVVVAVVVVVVVDFVGAVFLAVVVDSFASPIFAPSLDF
jgi:hypothetical protein